MTTTLTDGQIIKILMLLKEQNNNPETIQLGIENGMFADCFKQVAALRPDRLMELITRGKYDWVNDNITSKYFPVAEVPEWEGEMIFHFGRSISSEDVIAEMDKKGYRPATMAELLVYGAKNPEEQRKYPIVALGSAPVLYGNRRVGVLDGDDSSRGLRLGYFDGGWDDDYRFLAVRK